MEPRARAGKHVGKETFNPKEISNLLYAYGDVRDPIPETVRVLDELVTEFLEGVCFEASKHAQMAGRQKLKFDDFEFALRRNPQYLGKVRSMIEKRSEIKNMRKMFNHDDDKLAEDFAKDGADGRKRKGGPGGGAGGTDGADDGHAGVGEDAGGLLGLDDDDDDDLDIKDLIAETESRGSAVKKRKINGASSVK
ncbi:TFIID-18kDa-domain-containing protein [Xylariaceae sp. FL0255]|nr:TFIID-18kDa-domain-containing protein [Xylariaceae sp. FL0255]